MHICENEIPDEFFCLECKQTLCPQCERNHKRLAATKNHNIVLRTKLGAVDTMTLTCGDHGGQAFFRCETCNSPVCMKCVTGKHKGHKMVDLNVELEREKELVQDDITKMKNEILPELKNKREEIGREKEMYETKVKEIFKDMEDEHHSRLGFLTRIHKDRINILATIRDANLAKFDGYSNEIQTKINSCKERISKSEHIIRKKNLESLTHLSKSKIHLSEKERTRKLPEPPSFKPGNVHSIREIFGKLHVPPPLQESGPLKLTSASVVSRFISPQANYPKICCTKEGDVLVAGRESRELVMVDIKGNVLNRRKILNVSVALAVMDCGDIIISPHSNDSRSVSRLMKDGREQHVYDSSPFCSYGVSDTAEQKILICTTDGRVMRINNDGTSVKQIFKGSGEKSTMHAVEDAYGIIYISDMKNSAVVIVNKDGRVLTTITHTRGGQQLGLPGGLVVDKMNNVLCSDYYNNCVYIIDQNQLTRELVGSAHGIMKPGWLAVDDDNNLWITQEDGNILVMKYLSA